jgi:hypothetical protein
MCCELKLTTTLVLRNFVSRCALRMSLFGRRGDWKIGI